MTNQLVALEFCAVRPGTFYSHQDYEKINFYKKSSLYFIGWRFRSWKIAVYLQLARNCNFSTKVWKKILFYHYSQPINDVLQKEIENLELVQGVNFEFINSSKNNGTKYLLIFDDSCEEICNSRAFVDLATAGKHRGLSTIYIKHNLWCPDQSKLGRDVELHNTLIVLFKSPRDVMQVTTLSTELGLGSDLVDCYREATSHPFGQFLIDLSPRTDDRLRYCANSGSALSKIYILKCLKHLRTLDDEHTSFLYPPSVPIAFTQMQKPLSSVLPKRVNPFSMRMHSKSGQGKLASHKETSRGKISKRDSNIFSEMDNLEAKKKRFVVRKELLRITKVWLRSLLQSRIFQSIRLNNLPCIKMIL